jgi:hypothetical protein
MATLTYPTLCPHRLRVGSAGLRSLAPTCAAAQRERQGRHRGRDLRVDARCACRHAPTVIGCRCSSAVRHIDPSARFPCRPRVVAAGDLPARPRARARVRHRQLGHRVRRCAAHPRLLTAACKGLAAPSCATPCVTLLTTSLPASSNAVLQLCVVTGLHGNLAYFTDLC